MKVPFSYRSHFFSPVLVLSAFSHLALLAGTGGVFFSSPRFAVKQAPQSMEVIFLSEADPRPLKQPQESVFAIDSPDSLTETPVSKKVERGRLSKPPSVVSPSSKGVQHSFLPDSFKNLPPVYPSVARERGWEGTVILKVFVGPRGRVLRLTVEETSGHKILDEAAVKALRRWHFQPARAGGLSFASWVHISIRFLLVDQD